jgi:hypothetical protein
MICLRQPLENGYKDALCAMVKEELGMARILFSLAFATALLAFASSEASAFACQAVGPRAVAWGRSYFAADAKLIALTRCARRNRALCTVSYCVPG